MMKKLALSTALAALCATGAMAQDVVRIASEGNYAPYNFLDDNGNLAGFEIELGNEICARAELNCEWVINDWDSIIPNLVSGNYDVIMAGMSITPERDAVIDFSDDYYPVTKSAYAAASDSVDLEGGIVAAQATTIQAGYVAESGATLLEYATPDEAVQAVRDGEADAVMADYDYLLSVVNASGGELQFVGERVAVGGGIGAGVRESDAALRDTLSAAIASMKADGSLNALLAKWFSENEVVPAFE